MRLCRLRLVASLLLLSAVAALGEQANVAVGDGAGDAHADSGAREEAPEQPPTPADAPQAQATAPEQPEWRLREERQRREREEAKARRARANQLYARAQEIQASDPLGAAALFREAGSLGHMYALTDLAVMHAIGLGVEQSDEKALQLYIESARRGSSVAHMALAFRYAFGVGGVSKDCRQAATYFLPASRTALASASRQAAGEARRGKKAAAESEREDVRIADPPGGVLGRLLRGVLGPGAAGGLLEGAGGGRVADALEYAQARLEGGDARHALAMGVVHRYGMHGFERDPRRAARFFQMAAAAPAPDPLAFVHLGELHEAGQGVEASNATALAMYERAAALHSPLALDRLAAMHAHGRGLPPDPARALRLLRRALGAPEEPAAPGEEPALDPAGPWAAPEAAERAAPAPAGVGDAHLSLARLYYHGLGVPPDEARAAEALLRAAARGHRRSRHLYGRLVVEQLARAAAEGRAGEELALPCARAVRFMRAVAAGGPWAAVGREGADLWLAGREAEALPQLAAAAEMGDEGGLLNAAHALARLPPAARANLTADPAALARAFLDRAAAQGSPEGLVALADAEYARGRRAAAALLYRQAAEGPARAVRGVLADLPPAALEALVEGRAGKRGPEMRARAAFNLGVMAQYGRGIPARLDEAHRWYRLAGELHPAGSIAPRLAAALVPPHALLRSLQTAADGMPPEMRRAAQSILAVHLFTQTLLITWLLAALWRLRHLRRVDDALRRHAGPPPWPAPAA